MWRSAGCALPPRCSPRTPTAITSSDRLHQRLCPRPAGHCWCAVILHMLSGTRPNAAARRELDAAGITDPQLRTAYYRCRRLNAQHGRTYFLATRLLPTAQRPPIHALYGFARWVDDLVADLSAPARRAGLPQMLDPVEQELKTGLEGLRTEHPVLAAVAHTAARHAIEPALFSDFMTSMRMDLTVHEYPTREALNTYVHGSAAVIG